MWRIFIAGIIALNLTAFAKAQSIEWEIKDRFRTLGTRYNPSDGQRVRIDQDSYVKRIEEIIRESRPRSNRNGQYVPLVRANDKNDQTGGLDLNWRTTWQEGKRQFDLGWIHNPDRNVTVRIADIKPGAVCRWADIDRDTSCEDREVKMKLSEERQFAVIVKPKNGPEKSLGPVTVKPEDVFIAVIGDSYGSGEGNPHVTSYPIAASQDFYPAQWWDTRCHRSLLSSSAQAAGFLARADPHQSVTYINYACSGAEIMDGVLTQFTGRQTVPQTRNLWDVQGLSAAEIESVKLPNGQPGQYRDDHDQLPRQIDAISDAICVPGTNCAKKRIPDLLIVSIGGNDIGFGEIARDLLLSDPPDDKKRRDIWQADIKARIGKRFEALAVDFKKLAAEIGTRIKPKRVFLSQYMDPSVYSDERKKDRYCGRDARGKAAARKDKFQDSFDGDTSRNYASFHFAGQQADEIHTKLNYGRSVSLYGLLLTRDEAELAQWVVHGLNDTIHEAAKWDWADTGDRHASLIAVQDLKGPDDRRRGLCSESSWFVTILESWDRQNWVPKDYSGKNLYELHLSDAGNCPVALTDGKCKLAPGPLTTGVMHPNFFGHYNVGQVILRMMRKSLASN